MGEFRKIVALGLVGLLLMVAVASAFAQEVTPSVTANDQDIQDGTVTVAMVVSDGPGWMVIHADDNGAPGAVIGYAAVSDGENTDVVVEIDTAAATETLYAMLHVDAGEEGTYELPGADVPAQAEGEVVVVAFTVSGLTAMEDQQEQVAELETLPQTGETTTPWISLLLLEGGVVALGAGVSLLRRRQGQRIRIDD